MDDAALIRSARRGDADAFGALFVRHRALVLAYLTRRCAREDAADLLAETFASALVAVHDGRGPDGPTAAPWLLTIARNKLLDAHRRGRVEKATRRRLALEHIVAGDDDLDRLEALGADVDGALALALVDRLPAEQRVALRARILDEREYDEIAEEQRTSEGVVRQRVSRALRRMRVDMEEQR